MFPNLFMRCPNDFFHMILSFCLFSFKIQACPDACMHGWHYMYAYVFMKICRAKILVDTLIWNQNFRYKYLYLYNRV